MLMIFKQTPVSLNTPGELLPGFQDVHEPVDVANHLNNKDGVCDIMLCLMDYSSYTTMLLSQHGKRCF